MARVVLITGGARSGKSEYAQKMAERVSGRRMFIATCEVSDKELQERITRHKEAREGKGWQTIEEPVDLRRALDQAHEYEVILVDCLTLWINNLMSQATDKATSLTEEDICDLCLDVLGGARTAVGTVIFVTNEVGMGIVPDNELARRYRDLLGRCNQVFASKADEVVLMVSGIPVHIKHS